MKHSRMLVLGLMFSGTAQAACGWGGSASDFFRCLMDTSVVVDDHAATLAEVDGRVGSLEDAIGGMVFVYYSTYGNLDGC